MKLAALFATSGHSGVDRLVQRLLPAFAGQGVELDLLRIHSHGPELTPWPEGIRDVRLPCRHKRTAIGPLAWYLWRHHPDALLCANHRLNLTALRANRLTGRRSRVYVRIGSPPESVLALRERGYAHRQIREMRRWYPDAAGVITPTRGVRKALSDILPTMSDRVFSIPNPLDLTALQQRAKEPIDDAVLPFLDAPEPLVIGVGELSGRKDFATLVRAFARVRKQRPCRLMILGEGRERGALESLIAALELQGSVCLPGFVSNPYPLMQRASVLASSALFEGFGNVLVEAMALGTPVVATDCPHGPREILLDGRYGRLTPTADVSALAGALFDTLNAPTDVSTLVQAVSRYESRTVAAQYLQVLGEATQCSI